MKRNDAKIIGITGPAGAGKSTVAKELSKRFVQCAIVDIDAIKHFVEQGFVYDNTKSGIDQWELLTKNIIDVSKNFCEAGYVVIIEGYIDFGSPGWVEVLEALPVSHKFLLLPSLSVLQKRDLQRDKNIQMGPPAVKKHHEYFTNAKKFGFEIIDSSRQTVKVSVDLLYKRIL